MPGKVYSLEEQLARLEKQLHKERETRIQAEQLLEKRARELQERNLELEKLNKELFGLNQEVSTHLASAKMELEEIVQSAGDIIYLMDASGHFEFINQSAESITGYQLESLRQRHFLDIVHPSDRLRVRHEIRKILKRKQPSAYFAFDLTNKQGDPIHVGQRIRLWYDDQGRVKRAIGIARDLRDILHLAQDARRTQNRYESIIRSLKLGILVTDRSHRILEVDDRMCQMLGYAKEDLIGKDPKGFLLDPSFRQEMEQAEREYHQGKSRTLTLRLLRKDGTPLWFLQTAITEYDDFGNPARFVGVHLDISKMKDMEHALKDAKEEADKARRAEEAFMAHMSHEMRTPLHVIMGTSHLLQRELHEVEHKQMAGNVFKSSQMLLNLVNEVLDFSRMVDGEVEIQQHTVHLESVARAVKDMLMPLIEEAGLTFHLESQSLKTPIIQSDPELLQQVLINLLENAIKYTPEGNIGIRLRNSDADESVQGVLIEVWDEGVGISLSDKQKIFNRFFRADALLGKISGTGLGLSITRNLIQSLGGTIGVESELGKGSTFKVILPVGRPSLEDIPQLEPDEQNFGLTEASSDIALPPDLRLLLVEDNLLNQEFLAQLLHSWRCRVKAFERAEDAWEYLQKHEVDLLITDHNLSGQSGWSLIQRIRKHLSANKELPCLFLSAAESEFTLKVQDANLQVLRKPALPIEIKKALHKLLIEEPMVFLPHSAKALQWKSLGEGLVQWDAKKAWYLHDGHLEHLLNNTRSMRAVLNEHIALGSQAIRSLDPEKLYKAFHKMASSAELLGLSETIAFCVNIRKMKKENIPLLSKDSVQMHAEWLSVCARTRKLLRQMEERMERELNKQMV